MNGYTLTKEDYEFLENITKITLSINKLYKQLYELDLNNQKNSAEYIKVLDYLNVAVEAEGWQYNKTNLNFNKCMALIEYILNKNFSRELPNIDEFIITHQNDDQVVWRILANLDNRLRFDCVEVKRLISEQIHHSYTTFDSHYMASMVADFLSDNRKLEKSLEDDWLDAFLIIVEECLNNNDNSKFKSILLKAKYITTFINSNIESNMIGDSFNIYNIVGYNFNKMANYLNIQRSLFNDLKNKYGKDEFIYQRDELLKISDHHYKDEDKKAIAILTRCRMRAAFMFMDANTINDVNFNFHELVDRNNDRKTTISESIIVDAFKKINADRKKYKIIQFNNKNGINY